MAKRFTKNAMLAYCRKRAEILQKRHKFDLGNGTSQLTGRSQDEILAYGEMKTLLHLIGDIEGGYISE